MRNYKKTFLIILLTGGVLTNTLFGNDSTYHFTLRQAINHALQHNTEVKNARLDVKKSKKKIWETTAMGLPHADAKGGYSYMLTIPEQIEEFTMLGNLFGYMYQDNPQLATQMFGPPPEGESEESSSSDDLRESITLDLTVSQLIFSGPYLVGLRASKIYKKLSEVSLEKKEQDIVETVTNSYYLVLIAEENKRILDSTYQLTKQTYHEIKAMYESGYIDKTEADQLQLTLQTVESSALLIKRQLEISKRMLKFQMGLSIDDSVSLSDNLDQLVASLRLDASLGHTFNPENTLDYQLAKTQEELSKLNLRRQQSQSFPSISAYYQHHEEFNEEAFTFTPPDVIGATLNIPIFSSFQRNSKVNQAKIEYEQQKNITEQSEKGLRLKYEEAKSNYIHAIDKYHIEEKNLNLSKTIYKRSLKKYKEGMISSLNLKETQNQYLTAQRNYFEAIRQLIDAKLELDKLLNN